MNGIQPENCKIFSVKMGENRCDNGITPCLHAVVMDSCQICETCNTRLVEFGNQSSICANYQA